VTEIKASCSTFLEKGTSFFRILEIIGSGASRSYTTVRRVSAGWSDGWDWDERRAPGWRTRGRAASCRDGARHRRADRRGGGSDPGRCASGRACGGCAAAENERASVHTFDAIASGHACTRATPDSTRVSVRRFDHPYPHAGRAGPVLAYHPARPAHPGRRRIVGSVISLVSLLMGGP